ncbi:MAG: CvpA family protein [Alphaproteobacteria bacterium]
MSFLSDLNWVDIFILVILVLSSIAGLIRGFFKEICTLGVWLFSALGAWVFSKNLASKMVEWMGETTYAKMQRVFDNQDYLNFALRLTAGMIIFVILLIFLQILVSIFTSKVQVSVLSSADKVLGLVIGLVRGLLLLGVLWYFFYNVMGITAVTDGNKDKVYIKQVESSVMLGPVKVMSNIVKPILDPFVNRLSKKAIEDTPQENEAQDTLQSQTIIPQNQEENSQSQELPEITDDVTSPEIQQPNTQNIGNAQDATERAITPTVGQDNAEMSNPGLSDNALREIQELLGN